jgi:hypothetical protein
MFKRFSVQDLLIITAMVAISIVIKQIFNPMFKLISAPIGVPGGSFAGGFYMMWLVLAIVIISKPGTGIVFCILQAVLVMVIGIKGNQGLFTLVSYTIPGIIADLIFFLLRKPGSIVTHLTLCAAANITGAVIVAIGFFHHPLPVILVIAGMAFVSGCVGGWLSHSIHKSLIYYGII